MNGSRRPRSRWFVRDAQGMPGREYRLVVDGELSDHVGGTFADLTLTSDRGTTVLAGHIRDQSELQGILQRISDLGLTLLSATAIDDPAGRRR